MSLKDEYKVTRIKYDDTKEWLLKRHYAHRMPCITAAFGLFKDKVLVGVCTFGVPASPSLCRGICGEKYADKVLELNRLCIEESDAKNLASFFVGRCLTFFRVANIIVSYADTSQGHVGYVYQACNFLYTGLSAKRTDRQPIGYKGNAHSRHLWKVSKSEAEGVQRPQKHRYIYFCGRKHWKKLFKQNLKYIVEPYPKGETLRYNANVKITKQGMLFV